MRCLKVRSPKKFPIAVCSERLQARPAGHGLPLLCSQYLSRNSGPAIKCRYITKLLSPKLRTYAKMAVNIDLSNSDAWDDSALLKSWNEALKEYKVWQKSPFLARQSSKLTCWFRNITVYMFKAKNYRKFYLKKSWQNSQGTIGVREIWSIRLTGAEMESS